MLKRIASIILSLFAAVLLLMPTVAVSAEDSTFVVLDGKTYEIPVGETFTFETKVEMPGYSVATGRVVLHFDTNILETVLGDDEDIYDTDLDDVLNVGGYLANGTGCSFAVAGTQYSNSSILSGDDNVLVCFYFRAKAAGTTEIKFDSSLYEFSVFSKDDPKTPITVISAGKEVSNMNAYKFIGNFITAENFDYKETTEPPLSSGNDSSTSETDSGTIKTDDNYSTTVNDSGAVINGGNATANKLVLPETVSDSNGNDVPVTEIAQDAFLGAMATEIYIPASVTVIPDYSVGYVYEDGEYKKIDGFKIYGHPGSAAEEYAEKHGFVFVNADETPLETDPVGGLSTDIGFSLAWSIIIPIAVIAVICIALVCFLLLRKKKQMKK